MKNLRTEVVAGITTFFTMSYIIIVNPSILSTPGTGMPFSGVLTATVVLSCLMTLLMGVYARLPLAVAPGMGINAFFTFTLILGSKIPWPTALGIVFWSGALFLVASLSSIRVRIAHAIPENLRIAASTGIGLFLTFIGLKNAGIVVGDSVTLVKLGTFDRTLIFVGLGFWLMIYLLKKKNPFAFLSGIAVITGMAYLDGRIQPPLSWVSQPDFHSVLFKLDILGALKLSFLPAIVTLFFTDLFDSISTLVGCSYAAGLKDEKGNPLRLKEGLIVDAWATFTASLLGTAPGTAYIESAAGIEVGGRTGLTSIMTSICFIPFLFLAPLVGIVPAYATAPVLILVGALMFRGVKGLHLQQIEDLIPAFLTVILIPLTFSITQGILWGIITHVALFLAIGRKKEISGTLGALALASLALLIMEGMGTLR